MFMILPTSRSDPANNAQSLQETRTRVKKACNRCRIKKIKCNGHLPCARCERDEVVCRVDRAPADHKELSRSYIASLEEQQLSLLNALRELNRRLPDNSKMHDIMKQLQANGFDIGSLEPQDQSLQVNKTADDRENSAETPDRIVWNDSSSTVDTAAFSYLESFLPQGENLDSQNLSEFLWSFPDPTVQQTMQQDNFFNNEYANNEAILDVATAESTEFISGTGSGTQQQAHALQNFNSGLDDPRSLY